VRARLREVEQAVRNKVLEEKGAQITRTHAETVGILLRDTKDVDGIVIRLPRLLFVKDAGRVRVCVLNEAQALEIAASNRITTDPKAAMEYVESLDGKASDAPETGADNDKRIEGSSAEI
jgi:hypothetical protein